MPTFCRWFLAFPGTQDNLDIWGFTSTMIRNFTKNKIKMNALLQTERQRAIASSELRVIVSKSRGMLVIRCRTTCTSLDSTSRSGCSALIVRLKLVTPFADVNALNSILTPVRIVPPGPPRSAYSPSENPIRGYECRRRLPRSGAGVTSSIKVVLKLISAGLARNQRSGPPLALSDNVDVFTRSKRIFTQLVGARLPRTGIKPRCLLRNPH